MADGNRIVFLGPPNSGKGTQAVTLAESLGIPAISTGDMLRAAVAEGSELGKRVEGVMAAGELVSDELMAEVVKDRLAKDDAQGGFLLDGYPRTLPQADTLQSILDEQGNSLKVAILIDAPEDVLIARALERAKKQNRPDDKEDVVRERLRVYREKTAPLIGWFEERGLLRRVDGDQTIEQVGADVLKAAQGEA